jgi:hypothetical protein
VAVVHKGRTWQGWQASPENLITIASVPRWVESVRCLPRFDQPFLRQGGQQQIQGLFFQAVLGHPGAELAQHGVIETWITQLQPEQVLPVDTSTHGIRRLTIGQSFHELEDGDQSQSPRGFRWLPASGEKAGEAHVIIDAAELIVQP